MIFPPRSATADLLFGVMLIQRLYSLAVSFNRGDVSLDLLRALLLLVLPMPGNPNYKKVLLHQLIMLFADLTAAEADHVLRFWSYQSKYVVFFYSIPLCFSKLMDCIYRYSALSIVFSVSASGTILATITSSSKWSL